MKTNQISMDFQDGSPCPHEFKLFEKIISDRGSKYSVSGGYVKNRAQIKAFLKKLKSNKKYTRATHNTWAARITHDGRIFDIKNDDGETGAGNTILRMLQRENVIDTIVVVTRWFGGIKLQGDRFRHVQNATKYFLEHATKND